MITWNLLKLTLSRKWFSEKKNGECSNFVEHGIFLLRPGAIDFSKKKVVPCLPPFNALTWTPCAFTRSRVLFSILENWFLQKKYLRKLKIHSPPTDLTYKPEISEKLFSKSKAQTWFMRIKKHPNKDKPTIFRFQP